MDESDFDRMEQEAIDRLFEADNNCSNCGHEMIDKLHSKEHGWYKHCPNCRKNWKPLSRKT